MKGFYKTTLGYFYYHDGQDFKGIRFFDNNYELVNSLRYILEDHEFFDLPLPNKNSFKKMYHINDFVYFTTPTNIMIKGKVLGFSNQNDYIIQSCLSFITYTYYSNHEMVPYNWHIMHDRCKSAIFTWLLVCKRFPKIYKDIRILICNYIWETRHEFSGEV